MTLREYLQEKTELLTESAIPDAENEVWVILLTCTGRSKAELRFLLPDSVEEAFPSEVRVYLEEVFRRRAGHEPLAYIVGHAPFYDMEFSVGKGVLIPRFDSEILVETALACLGVSEFTVGIPPETPVVSCWNKRSIEPVVIFDLCTGSGILGITLAHHLAAKQIPCRVILTEISQDAAAFAQKNVETLIGKQSRTDVKVEITDLWPQTAEKADLIVSNPPYIPQSQMQGLLPEVKEHEPALALTDGGDGLSMYRRIFSGVGRYLKTGGALLLEHGFDQAQAVRELAGERWEKITCIQDYGQQDRVTCGIYRGEA